MFLERRHLLVYPTGVRLTLVLLVACSSQPAYSPAIVRCPVAADPPTVDEQPAPAHESDRAGSIRGELERLDREIDALDNEIATFAPPAPSREAAMGQTLERQVAARQANLDGGGLEDAPREMAYIAAQFFAARTKQY